MTLKIPLEDVKQSYIFENWSHVLFQLKLSDGKKKYILNFGTFSVFRYSNALWVGLNLHVAPEINRGWSHFVVLSNGHMVFIIQIFPHEDIANQSEKVQQQPPKLLHCY